MYQIRVLVIDDSAFMRKIIPQILQSEKEINVIGTARDGIDGLEKIRELQPDVITLDVEMPRMDGLSMLKKLMKDSPLPVVMLSSMTQVGSVTTIEALEAGAIDFVPKPSGAISLDVDKVKNELIEKVKVASRVKLNGLLSGFKKGISDQDKNNYRDKLKKKQAAKNIITVGSSTGGPQALCKLIPMIDSNISAGIAVVQHMPPLFTNALAKRLDKLSSLNVIEAGDGDLIREGTCLVAPGGYHLEVNSDGSVKLTTTPPVKAVRPAVDVLMSTAAKVYENRTVGVILTGMGNDGTVGMAQIKKYGGKTVAQDESTCVVFGMPRSAIEKGYVDKIMPLDRIPKTIMSFVEEINNAG